ncbi:MAG TPA: BPTI/Kunitz domain-containing protein, partial [Polyangiaceae bacterium]|nr:BPTI/Kunitz domain-containing protein [Polyangiaceae bacterium]
MRARTIAPLFAIVALACEVEESSNGLSPEEPDGTGGAVADPGGAAGQGAHDGDAGEAEGGAVTGAGGSVTGVGGSVTGAGGSVTGAGGGTSVAGTPAVGGSVTGAGGGTTTDVCELPFDAGHCDAYFPVYSFDANRGGCYQTYYGGCDGNANRFDTLEECEAACGASIGVGGSTSAGGTTGAGGAAGAGGTPGAGGVAGNASCCSERPEPGCDGSDVERCVCDNDAFCCSVGWDAACVDEVEAFRCGDCGSPATGGAPGAGGTINAGGAAGESGAATDVCALPFEAGTCEAAIPVFAFDAATGT